MIKLSTQFHTVLLYLHVAVPATFLPSNGILGPFFPLRAARLFTNEQINKAVSV